MSKVLLNKFILFFLLHWETSFPQQAWFSTPLLKEQRGGAERPRPPCLRLGDLGKWNRLILRFYIHKVGIIILPSPLQVVLSINRIKREVSWCVAARYQMLALSPCLPLSFPMRGPCPFPRGWATSGSPGTQPPRSIWHLIDVEQRIHIMWMDELNKTF